jgi:hypothetical protein
MSFSQNNKAFVHYFTDIEDGWPKSTKILRLGHKGIYKEKLTYWRDSDVELQHLEATSPKQ